MPFNLLLLPLLGGFIFTRYWNKTYYETLRAENERLLLVSSIWGLLFLAVAFVVTSYARIWWPELAIWWHKHVVDAAYSATSCLAFLLGALSWIPLNWFFRKERQVSKLIEENGDRFELLLKKAQDEEKTVSVTLKNGKFYTGFVKATLSPASRIRSVGIIPTRSGYRETDTNKLIFTREYAPVYDEFTKEYDSVSDELSIKEKALEERSAHLKTKTQEMERVSNNARTDVIDDPNATRVRGELDAIHEDITMLHKRILELKDKLERLTNITEDYETIIPVGEICILSIYDHDLYQKYFAIQ